MSWYLVKQREKIVFTFYLFTELPRLLTKQTILYRSDFSSYMRTEVSEPAKTEIHDLYTSTRVYPKRFRTESIKKYTLTTIKTR
jgi:hypothetical protein